MLQASLIGMYLFNLFALVYFSSNILMYNYNFGGHRGTALQ